MYQMELRNRLTPEQYLEEIYIREAMPTYYDTIEMLEERIFVADARGDVAGADVAQYELDDFKERFLRMHPIFADSIGRNRDRNEARKAERDALLAMPRSALPEGEHVDQVLNLMVSYAQFEREMQTLAGQRSTGAQNERVALRDEFYAWVNEYVRENPAADSYYQSVIRFDRILEGVETQFTYEYGS
jgi:hypothetical protein